MNMDLKHDEDSGDENPVKPPSQVRAIADSLGFSLIDDVSADDGKGVEYEGAPSVEALGRSLGERIRAFANAPEITEILEEVRRHGITEESRERMHAVARGLVTESGEADPTANLAVADWLLNIIDIGRRLKSQTSPTNPEESTQ